MLDPMRNKISAGFIGALFYLVYASLALAQSPLRVGTIFSPTQAPLWAAVEARLLEKFGIKDLEIIRFSGGQPAVLALITGDLQISSAAGAAAINARLNGADVVIVARTVSVFPYTLYVSSDIREPSQLKGKKVAVSRFGGSGYEALLFTLKHLGLDPKKDVTILQVGGFAERLAGLSSGTFNATLLNPPFTLRAREMGLRPLYDLTTSGITYPMNQVATTRTFIKSHRQTVNAFLKSLVSGLARFRTDREFGIRVLSKNLRETDRKILEETYDFWVKSFPKIPYPGPEDATVFLELMQVKGQHDPKEFVDASLMDDLEREGFLAGVYK